MERAFLVLSALVLNAVLGGPRQLYVMLGLVRLGALPGQLVRHLQRKLDREHRSLPEREMRGTLVVAAAFVASVLGGWLVQALGLPFLDMLIVSALLPVRPLWDRGRQLQRRLRAGDLPGAREVLEGTVWRSYPMLDNFGLARAGIEMLSVQFADKILAPLLWYFMLGLPGLLFSRCLTLLVESVPGRADSGFGKTARQLREFMHYVPVRLAALLWLGAAAFMPAARGAERLFTTGQLLSLPDNSGVSLLAVGQRMGLALGGPLSPYGPGWWGTGNARPLAAELGQALFLFLLVHALLFVLLGLVL